jgi:hypothetical protein
MHPGLSRGHGRFRDCGLSRLYGAAILHRFYGGLPRPAILGSNARASEESVMDEKTESAGTVAMVAGLIAAVRLARVDSEELTRRSPRVRCAIADSFSIAEMVIAETKARR